MLIEFEVHVNYLNRNINTNNKRTCTELLSYILLSRLERNTSLLLLNCTFSTVKAELYAQSFKVKLTLEAFVLDFAGMTISQAVVTTRRARYLNAYQSQDDRVKVSRPTILNLPYTLLASIFIISQTKNLAKTCQKFANISKDPYIRARFLEYRYQQRNNQSKEGSFYVQLLREFPPVENTALWKVLKNRKMLGESPDRDIYWEMKRKEVHIHESVDMWKSKPERRSLILNWLADICEDFTWATCTRYIAFTLFDRFMSLSPMPSIEELQVLACACVSLAGKAEETNLVRNSDMADIGQTTPKLLMDAEFRVLDTVKWEYVLLPTAETFLAYFVVNLNISSNKKIVRRRDSLNSIEDEDQHYIVTNVNSIVDALEVYVYDEARYIEALTHLDVLYRDVQLTNGLLPSKLASLALWRVKNMCRKLTVAEFEACTDYRWTDIAQLNATIGTVTDMRI